MEQGTPLYLDWESDHDDFVRVVYDVCRNLGAYPLPRFVYRDMHGYRLRDQLDVLTRMIDRERVSLVVLDAVAAAGGSTGEHMTWEAVALEMEACLGALPQVTVLALDHVTGAEHKAGSRSMVPIKARGAERKLEYTRNQWTLMTDEEAERLGRHVVTWHHTKLNLGPKEPPFATEIVHRHDEVSIILRPMETYHQDEEPTDEASRLVRILASTSGRSVRDLCLQVDGKEPSRTRYQTVRTALERAVQRGHARKERVGSEVRYRADNEAVSNPQQGTLIPFPGSSA
jgi:hypothetical protein